MGILGIFDPGVRTQIQIKVYVIYASAELCLSSLYGADGHVETIELDVFVFF